MNKVLITFAVVLSLAITGGTYWYFESGQNSDIAVESSVAAESSAPTPTVTEAEAGPDENIEEVILTAELVGEHNTPDDCWFIIDGMVYDVTDFVSAHPGGEAILKGCGKDATELFATKDLGANAHGHSGAAKAMLEALFIGELGQTL